MTRRSDETWFRLREWTKGQTEAERLAAHILSAEGYLSIDPSHPLGGPDGLKDVLCKREGKTWVGAAYFPRGEVSFSEIADKFKGDMKGVEANDAEGFAFVTNQELRLSERRSLQDEAHAADIKNVDIFHLERVAHVLDRPKNYGIRLQYLDLEMTKDEQVALFATLDERGAVQPAQITLQLANVEERMVSGSSAELNSIVWDLPFDIPRYAPKPMSIGYGMSYSEPSNPDYYREYADYIDEHSLLQPIGLALSNEGAFVVTNTIAVAIYVEGTNRLR